MYKNTIVNKIIRQKNLIYGKRFNRMALSSRGEQKFLLLGTLPRSGTHFARNLLTNYFTILSEDKEYSPPQVAKIASNNFQYDLFDINSPLFRGPIKSNKLMQNAKFRGTKLFDISRTHLVYSPKLFSAFHTIHLRRNPVDFFTSYIQYMFLKRGHCFSEDLFWNVYNSKKTYYENMIKSYDNAKSVLIYDYTDLVENPSMFIRKSVKFLGLDDLSEQAIERAIRVSSLQNTLKIEAKNQRINPTANINGSFMNIGETKFLLNKRFQRIIENEILCYKN